MVGATSAILRRDLRRAAVPIGSNTFLAFAARTTPLGAQLLRKPSAVGSFEFLASQFTPYANILEADSRGVIDKLLIIKTTFIARPSRSLGGEIALKKWFST
jgi:hypothetical protein